MSGYSSTRSANCIRYLILNCPVKIWRVLEPMNSSNGSPSLPGSRRKLMGSGRRYISIVTRVVVWQARLLLLLTLKNVASVQGFYAYPISPQRVSPVSPFNGNNAPDHYRTSPLPLSPPSSHTTSSHSRQNSADSLLKLPVPPSKTRSSPSSRSPPFIAPNSFHALQSIDQGRVLTPSSTNRSVSPYVGQPTHKVSESGSSSELDIASWLAQQPDGSVPRGLKSRPSLTAVRTAYPSPVAVNQRPRPAPSTPSESPTNSPTSSMRRPTWNPLSPTGSPVQYVARKTRPVPLVGPPPMGRKVTPPF